MIFDKKEPNLWMLIPMIIMTALAVLMGICPGPVMNMLTGIAGSVL